MWSNTETVDSAFALHQAGRVSEAVAMYERLLLRQPADAALLFLLGTAHLQMRKFEQAVARLDRAIALNKNYAPAYGNRGLALKNLGRLDEALASCDRAVKLDAADALSWISRSNVLHQLKRFDEALASAERALMLRPDHAEAHNNRGVILKDLGRLEDALASYDRAIALVPNYAEAHSNRGALLQSLRRLEEAGASYDEAIRLDPSYARAMVNKANLLLLTGRYAEGWKLYESRFADEALDSKPVWRGEDIRGKRLLVRAEQGFGDMIQFCRYLPLVHARGAEIIFEARGRLMPVMDTLKCPMTIVANGVPLPVYDLSCRLLSLPHIFQTSLDSIPAEVPYLFANPDKVLKWEKKLGPKQKFRIGLAWSGSEMDRNRSVPLEEISALAGLPVELHSLHKEYRGADLALLSQTHAIHQHQDDQQDFSDTAALIANMDLVISVDTAVAHLAGAMGKPLWLLAPFVPDHRWFLDREDSPWYPAAKLYRQDASRSWPVVIGHVIADLRRLTPAGLNA